MDHVAAGQVPAYVYAPTLYRLTVERYPGVLALASAPALGDLAMIRDAFLDQRWHPLMDDAGMESFRAALFLFSQHLTEWNLTDQQGNPVKPTDSALAQLEFWLAYYLMQGWVIGVTEPPAPLGGGRPASEEELEHSIPMDPPVSNEPPVS